MEGIESGGIGDDKYPRIQPEVPLNPDYLEVGNLQNNLNRISGDFAEYTAHQMENSFTETRLNINKFTEIISDQFSEFPIFDDFNIYRNISQLDIDAESHLLDNFAAHMLHINDIYYQEEIDKVVRTTALYGFRERTDDPYMDLRPAFYYTCKNGSTMPANLIKPEDIKVSENQLMIRAAVWKSPNGRRVEQWATPNCFRWCTIYKGVRRWFAGCRYSDGRNHINWGRDENGNLTYFEVKNYDNQSDASECVDFRIEFTAGNEDVMDSNLWDASTPDPKPGYIPEPEINTNSTPKTLFHAKAPTSLGAFNAVCMD